MTLITTDRSIFEEFDKRTMTEQREEAVQSVPARIGKLTAQNVDDQALMQMFGLTLRELGDIRKLDEYKAAHKEGTQDEIERPLEIDDSWDAIERKSLKVAREHVDFMGPEDALRMAAIANRATRRTRESTMKDASKTTNIETVNIAVPHAFMKELQEMSVSKEMQKLIDANSETKIVDLARPQRIDEMMQEKVRVEKQDFDIMEALEID